MTLSFVELKANSQKEREGPTHVARDCARSHLKRKDVVKLILYLSNFYSDTIMVL